jgi:hypothetical protein
MSHKRQILTGDAAVTEVLCGGLGDELMCGE